ncbi:MAG TPA: ubiquitin carboxyl-terminal hydrolase family protein, partial [Myxococcota bacterium]|nr:ubiquitin carboxyl-terminal hydrolase family protein [Myxococcota bacterium]
FDGIDKTRQMKTDGSVNIQYQKFNSIQLALDQTNETLTLEQLLANRAKEEIETSDPKTRSRQITIHQAPKTLILQLSRFTAAGKKITTKVQYPAKLSLTTAFDGPITFELFAVILHAGTLSGGHYTANVKSGNGKWFNANDSVVTAIDEAEALRDQAGAYVLFYRRAP